MLKLTNWLLTPSSCWPSRQRLCRCKSFYGMQSKVYLAENRQMLFFRRKRASRRAKSCWRRSSAASWPATVNPFPPSSSWTPSVWTTSWRSRRRWCSNICLKLCCKISSVSPAGWWNTDATRVSFILEALLPVQCCCSLLLLCSLSFLFSFPVFGLYLYIIF